ncbi:hypothetical protein G9A89_022554 [Geosiphon pyriformis]|nr:hypothetical protein G9A89_022554 [Geosiphon pyriformis]
MAQDPLQQNILITIQDIQTALGWTPANAGEDNTSFITWFETKFRTPMLIFKWHMELEKKTQGPRKIVTEYAKVIRKLIKCVDSELRTDLSYAFWPLLVLKDNPTMDMAIELVQRIEDNQRIHLGSIFPVFAPAPVMIPAPQIVAISFVTHTQDPNEQLIDRLTANLIWLLEPLV